MQWLQVSSCSDYLLEQGVNLNFVQFLPKNLRPYAGRAIVVHYIMNKYIY